MIALLRSVAAVLVGYTVFAASALALFRLSGHAPHAPASVPFMAATIAWGIVFAAGSGWIAAWIAGRRPVAHGLALAALIVAGAASSVVASTRHDSIWTQVAAIALMSPAAVLGGWLRARRAGAPAMSLAREVS